MQVIVSTELSKLLMIVLFCMELFLDEPSVILICSEKAKKKKKKKKTFFYKPVLYTIPAIKLNSYYNSILCYLGPLDHFSPSCKVMLIFTEEIKSNASAPLLNEQVSTNV